MIALAKERQLALIRRVVTIRSTSPSGKLSSECAT
jgi:hypothetical protein